MLVVKWSWRSASDTRKMIDRQLDRPLDHTESKISIPNSAVNLIDLYHVDQILPQVIVKYI